MKNLLELREVQAEKLSAMESLVNLCETESRGFTDAEKQKFDALQVELDTIKEDVRRAEVIEKNRANKAEAKAPEQKLAEKYSMKRAVDSLLKNSSLTGAEAEMQAEAESEARHAGIGGISGVGMPSWMIRFDAQKRTDWNLTTPGDGGYNVQQTIQNIAEPLRPVSILSQMGITTRQGLTGNLRFPVDTAGSGAWETEVSASDSYSPNIGVVDSSPKRFGALATLSKQLLAQQSNISEAYIRRQLELTIGTAIDQTGIEGGGSNEPVGILGNAGVTVLHAGLASGSGVNANGAALVWGDLVKLWSTVAQSNIAMENLYFLTNAKVYEAGSAKPRQSSGQEGNFIFNETRRVYGEQVMLSNNVPSDLTKGGSSELSAMIYGNFNELALHQWGGVDLVLDPYTLAANAQVRIIANIWVDWCITRPTAFAVIKDLVA
jgi:HK97 family phage major capsid protein